MSYKITVVVVAGGRGSRLGADIPKQFMLLAGRPIVMRTIERFLSFGHPNWYFDVVLVLPANEIQRWDSLCQEHRFTLPHRIAIGGASRFESVKAGLGLVIEDCDVVLIHDGVRPFVSDALIGRVVDGAIDQGAAIPAISVVDTIRSRSRGMVLDRADLVAVQTPQGFQSNIIRTSYQEVVDGAAFTDDGSVVQSCGHRVAIVEGEQNNIKITTQFDTKIAQQLWHEY